MPSAPLTPARPRWTIAAAGRGVDRKPTWRVCVASGSATLEAALSGTPMVVVYRLGRASYFLGKPFVNLPFYSMVNLIAERELVPELIQSAMTPANIVEQVTRLLDEDNAQTMRRGLAKVKQKLGGGGASAHAAEAVLSHFELS